MTQIAFPIAAVALAYVLLQPHLDALQAALTVLP